jgi:hypothetical protein
MPHNNVTKVVMTMVSGVSVHISWFKVSTFKLQRLDNSRKRRNIRTLKHLNPEPLNPEPKN